MAKDIATKKEAGALANFDYGQDAGAGFSNQTSEDVAVPFIGILQSNSPQVTDGDKKGGDMFNTVTEDTYKGEEGICMVPATTEHCFVEWVPRTQGGGFVARHEADSPVVLKAKANADTFGRYKTEDGNDLVETFYVYGVLCEDGNPTEMAILAFTSTKVKVYKRWNTRLNMFTVQVGDIKQRPPLFAHAIRITTVKQENAKGKFYNYQIAPVNGDLGSSLLKPTDPCFQAAKACMEMVTAGTAKAAYDSQEKAAATGDSSDGGPF